MQDELTPGDIESLDITYQADIEDLCARIVLDHEYADEDRAPGEEDATQIGRALYQFFAFDNRAMGLLLATTGLEVTHDGNEYTASIEDNYGFGQTPMLALADLLCELTGQPTLPSLPGGN